NSLLTPHDRTLLSNLSLHDALPICFMEGDKVVIDPALDATPGSFVVAKRISDQAVTFKQLRREGDDFYLYALNEAWPERVIKLTEEWHICGRARWKISDL